MNDRKIDPAVTGESGAGEIERGGFDDDGEGEDESDAVDLKGMTLEREAPVVEDARVDHSSLLAGDREQDLAGGSKAAIRRQESTTNLSGAWRCRSRSRTKRRSAHGA
jgi:hypothetical protein